MIFEPRNAKKKKKKKKKDVESILAVSQIMQLSKESLKKLRLAEACCKHFFKYCNTMKAKTTDGYCLFHLSDYAAWYGQWNTPKIVIPCICVLIDWLYISD